MAHLPHIARLAKSLRVLAQISAAAHNWNDVVENKYVFASTPNAGNGFPFSTLERGEVFSVSRSFSSECFDQMSASSKHHVSILKPSFLGCCAHQGASFKSVFVAFGWASFLFSGISAFALAYPSEGFCAMASTPKWVVFSHHGFADAVPVLTGHAPMFAQQVISTPVMQDSADATRDHLSCFLSRHGNSDNGVKSVETPLYAFERVRAIPSQAMQECIEGLTTRAWSPERTVKPHERTTRKGRFSLSYAGMHRSAGKELRDNTTDEIINISPNSPISAASFNWTQYAGAVTMSGLEMLQNSSKEAIIDLMDGRVSVAEAELQNRIDYDLYQDGKQTSAVYKFDQMLETPVKSAVRESVTIH